MADRDPLAKTRAWVARVVVGLDLCPFAAAPLAAGAVRFDQSRAAEPQEVLAEVLGLVERMREPGGPRTALLVIPRLFPDFEDFLDLCEAARDLLAASGYRDDVVVVGFHPDYRFAGAPEDDPANATNRSPYPTLHLLWSDDIGAAAREHPDIAGIPERNIALLRAMGPAALRLTSGEA